MKKFIALLLALCMVMALAACSAKDKKDDPETSPEIDGAATDKPQESDEPEETKKPEESAKPEESEEPTVSAAPAMSMSDILTSTLSGIADLPMLMETPLTEDLYQSYLGIDYITGSSALASDAAIGSIAHSVVLLKLPDDADLDATVDLVYSSANPRKWICVEAEKVRVMKGDTASGKYVLLVMSTEDVAEAVVNNFAYVMSTLG